MAAVYEKYTVRTVVDSYSIAGPYSTGRETFTTSISNRGYTDYNFNASTGVFTPRGGESQRSAYTNGNYYSRITVYYEFGETMRGCTIYGGGGETYRDSYEWRTAENSSHTEPGELLERLVAEAGEYPENGIRDGYWYVLTDANAFPYELYVQKGGALRPVQTAVVCRGGELYYGLAGVTAGRR